MVKGTESLDPDGYPLLYTGSRDGKLRIVALDRDVPTELWALHANARGVWNNDWDGSPAIVEDVMYVGGEDSFFYAVQLNRSYEDGVWSSTQRSSSSCPGFGRRPVRRHRRSQREHRELRSPLRGPCVLRQLRGADRGPGRHAPCGRRGGPDRLRLLDRRRHRRDHYDRRSDGMLYVAVELQRFLPRAQAVGQLVKLDPYTHGDPVVWSVAVPPRRAGDDGGIWATPTLGDGVLYVSTHAGDLIGVDTRPVRSSTASGSATTSGGRRPSSTTR
jgi:hypothetical protein